MTFHMMQVLALALLHVAAGATEKDTSKLMVHIPHSLYKAEGYDHKEALFGMPPYGGSIAQNVYYANSTLCDANVDTSKGYPEREDDAPWPFPFILLVDRGDCSFTSKVRNAQRVGAAAVLIADTSCLCSDMQCQSDLPCEANEPIMSDDGSGGDITIPSMLVFKNDADLFKKELMANRHIRIEMTWSLPSPDDRVEYDLWTVPSDPISRDFILNFKKIAIGLDHHAYFSPHMYIYDGARSGCLGANSDRDCDSLCTNNGRYCATDPDGDVEAGVSGADVVRESLRRLCIWEHYGERDGVGMRWWDYVENFEATCNNADLFASMDCIETVFTQSGVDAAIVERCMKDSGGVNLDVPNNKLDQEISEANHRGVVVIPTAYVNEVPIRGALTPTNIFTAICAGFATNTEPVMCKQCSRCPNPLDCAETGFCTNTWEHKIIDSIGQNEGKGITPITFFLTMCFCMGLVAAVGMRYHSSAQNRMRGQMRELLAQYMPLEDDGDNDVNMNNPMELGYDVATRPLMTSGMGEHNNNFPGGSGPQLAI